MKLVRLKPYDPRRGFVLRRFSYRGLKFQEERGWYHVEDEIAEYLEAVRQQARDEHSPLAFDVCSEAEAKKIDVKEEAEANPRVSASEAAKSKKKGKK